MSRSSGARARGGRVARRPVPEEGRGSQAGGGRSSVAGGGGRHRWPCGVPEASGTPREGRALWGGRAGPWGTEPVVLEVFVAVSVAVSPGPPGGAHAGGGGQAGPPRRSPAPQQGRADDGPQRPLGGRRRSVPCGPRLTPGVRRQRREGTPKTREHQDTTRIACPTRPTMAHPRYKAQGTRHARHRACKAQGIQNPIHPRDPRPPGAWGGQPGVGATARA